MEHPNWGGWGGPYELYQPSVAITDPKTIIGGDAIPQETHPIWTNAVDNYMPPLHADYGRAIHAGDKSFKDFKVTLWRWRDDFQNDFAACMDWTTRPYREANHPPVIVLDQAAAITVQSGKHFGIGAHATDPDGDSLTYYWFQDPEAGTFRASLDIGGEDMASIYLAAPKVDKPETIHFILKVIDKGTPPLSCYKRVIVTVLP